MASSKQRVGSCRFAYLNKNGLQFVMLLMKKYFTFLLLMIICNGHAQTSETLQTLHISPVFKTEDQRYIDSLKKIINKGSILNSMPGKKESARQLRYVSACFETARYYERAYDYGKLTSIFKAIYYYKKIYEIALEVDRERHDASSIIGTANRILAKIYLEGKGVRKNLKLSLKYALKGVGVGNEFFNSYSQRYINTQAVFLAEYKLDPNDSAMGFSVNPFLLQCSLSDDQLKHAENKVGLAFFQKCKKEELTIELQIGGYNTSIMQEIKGWRLLRNIKNYLSFRMKIPYSCIKINTNADENWAVYKGFDVPYVRISYKKIAPVRVGQAY